MPRGQGEKNMKKWMMRILLGVGLAFGCLPATAQTDAFKGELKLSNGYRVDNLDWNIAGNPDGRSPNVLSELAWSDLEIFQLKAAVRVTVRDVFYLRGSLAHGWIFDGRNRDSDFLGDNRTGEFSRSNNGSDDGAVWDASAGAGYAFALGSGKLRIIPLIGYSYHQQNLTIRDGNQTVSRPPSNAGLGPFGGLDSTYETEWRGPWIGFDLDFQASDRIMLSSAIEYHWADYDAVADWNLRPDLLRFRSFEHHATGQGFVLSLGLEYLLAGPWSIDLAANYQQWSTDAGTDLVFLNNGAILATRLNEVNWDSFAILIGATYCFGR